MTWDQGLIEGRDRVVLRVQSRSKSRDVGVVHAGRRAVRLASMNLQPPLCSSRLETSKSANCTLFIIIF